MLFRTCVIQLRVAHLRVCNNYYYKHEGFPLKCFLPISWIAGFSIVAGGSCKGTVGASRLRGRNSLVDWSFDHAWRDYKT